MNVEEFHQWYRDGRPRSPYARECVERLGGGPYIIDIRGRGGKVELVSDDLRILGQFAEEEEMR